ncbi:MAG: NapC/NirT family cytochrome c [Rhodospirillales bacterium]|nr:NapC/NirT family cytochrome c [Rhodospirillales bacterium]
MSTETLIGRLLKRKYLGASLGGALVLFAAGIVFWGGFNTVLEATNTMPFCTGCHVMESTVYQEYKHTIHYENRTGVRAVCSDCHVPNPWVYKFLRKIQASNEVLHWLIGSINTPEKFEDKRLTLAKNVWKSMKDTDSRECRNCHSNEGMSKVVQKPRAAKQHENMVKEGQTCIDCHKGIAHRPIHKALPDDYAVYDGKADRSIKLPVVSADTMRAEMLGGRLTPLPASAAAPAAPAAAPASTAAATPAPAASGGAPVGNVPVNWDKAAALDIPFFYPGQTGLEWILKGTDHGGARPVRRGGDRCFECHGKEQPAMGEKMATGAKAEATPIPKKRAAVAVQLKAAHDGKNLYLRFQWPDAPHTPAPFAPGGKMDAENQIKFAMMIAGTGIDLGEQGGCWVTCHQDSRYMSEAPKAEGISADLKAKLGITDGPTKYLAESRTAIELANAPRGGWDKVKPQADLDALMKAGTLMELSRFKSGKGQSESGYVLEKRVMEGGVPTAYQGGLANGVWTVVMTRPLAAGKPGFQDLAPGKLYTVGFALHDDFTNARFHHVSLEYKLGLDNAEAQINAVKQ